MLIVRAPVRLSFAGGGTDLPAYYERHGGAVVSTTIDKYFYAIATLTADDHAQVSSADYHTFFRSTGGGERQSDLDLVRMLLDEFAVERGVSIFLASEIPPGTGLGSSSTVAVAMTKALAALAGGRPSDAQVAEFASHVEIDRMAMPIGRQDQYAAAFGGLNLIRFERHRVDVEPLRVDPEVLAALERRTLLFFTGVTRSASSILREQRERTATREETATALHELKQLALDTADWLRTGDLDCYGRSLDAAWELKRQLSGGISNEQIDAWYRLALQRGALGGKIAGAGGGGFLMLYCPDDAIARVTEALEAEGLRRFAFHFESSGATVLVNHVPGAMSVGRMPAFFDTPVMARP